MQAELCIQHAAQRRATSAALPDPALLLGRRMLSVAAEACPVHLRGSCQASEPASSLRRPLSSQS